MLILPDSHTLRISSPQEEGSLRVSKWIKVQVLLDATEMEELFAELGSFSVFCVSDVVTSHQALISHSEFLRKYREYSNALKQGEVPEEVSLKRYFSAILTTTPEFVYAMQVGQDKYLIKALRPVVQLQLHRFFVSSVDGKFHPMVLGEESITWGLQFSYPQIFQDPKNHQFSKVTNTPDFPNTQLFLHLMRWIRKNTIATPFVREGVRVNVPMRLGKKCFSWIGSHPQLPAKGLTVYPLDLRSKEYEN
jgi:hypothetical protein